MRRVSHFVWFLGLILPLCAGATTIRVPNDQPTIQAGINAALSGDTVLVAPGVFSGPGNQGIAFNGVDLALKSDSGPDQTIIVCEGAWGVRFHSGESTASLVQGFTIRLGVGGGVLCQDASPTIMDCQFESCIDGIRSQGSAAAPVISNCSFAGNAGGIAVDLGARVTVSDCSFNGNSPYTGGGALSVNGAWASLSRCTFVGNTGSQGAVVLDHSSVGFGDCEFSDNVSNGDGGAVCCADASFVSFLNCEFSNNKADLGAGGAVSSSGSFVTLDNCIVTGNTAGIGAGVYNAAEGWAMIRGCTFYGNAATGGAGVAVIGASSTIENTIIAGSPRGNAALVGVGGKAFFTCSDLFGNFGGDWSGAIAGQLGVNGNIRLDPMFCDAGAGDLTLNAQSPCAPGNSPPGCGLIGALPVGCGVTDVADEAPSASLRLTVIPNPVRGVARFEAGSAAAFTTLRIFDSQGRLVEQLLREEDHWQWMPGSSVPAGVYFARTEAGPGGSGAVKFLYLR